jgi:serine/threonine protein phosphatase PrpC
MQFQLLDSLSLPGDPAKANEDSFSHAAGFACVFDGATVLGENLMPGPSDAQWIAQFGARRLRAHAEDQSIRPREALQAASADAEKSFKALRKRAPAETYETPFASLMALFVRGERLGALWFGDCAALIRSPGGGVSIVGETISIRAAEQNRVSKLADPDGVAATAVREKFLPALRASRNRVNRKGGSWLFAPDARCADHANEARLPVETGSLVLLATDGFFALITDYGRYSAEELIAAAQSRGLAVLGQELRGIEAADPKGVSFPRFKRSDDATALLLSLDA